MRYRFDRFELDTQDYALRAAGAAIHVEPLVFDLLAYFAERPGQVVTRDAMIEHVWKGRIVSDATVSSCIKSARKALGDDGQSQHFIRTIRGRGFQFAATVASDPVGAEPAARPGAPPSATEANAPVAFAAPRIAVLPLFPLSRDPDIALLGDALAQEVIVELSRLHWLFIIARGSSFKFRGQEIDLDQAGRVLGVDYLVTGTIMQQGAQCVAAVELCRTNDGTVIWAERFTVPVDEIMHLRSSLAGQIVGALEPRLHASEAMRAAKVPTECLDAWAAYHRGLWHMYRFNRHDNQLAAQFFSRAVCADPGFSRGHAGLSFTHFQNAFLGFSADIEGEKRLARTRAARSLDLDPLDPLANLTMGRAEWIAGDLEGSLPWIERSIALSPNYAFAIYNSALVGTLLGEGEKNETKVAKAIALSPIDPLSYAMLATRALTYLVRGDIEVAADWAERAARSPNAHVQIFAIAAITNERKGNRQQAEHYASLVRRLHPAYSSTDFLKFFPFNDGKLREDVRASLQRLGF